MYTIEKTMKSLFYVVVIALAMIGMNAEAQRVIYPEGKTCAEPGETVIVEFDNKVDNYVFDHNKIEKCYEATVLIFIPISGGNCAKRQMGATKENDYSVKFNIPTSAKGEASYRIYYAKQSYLLIGADKVFLYRKNEISPLDFFDISVCTEDPVVRYNGGCFCPGSTVKFDVENFYGNHQFKVSYDDKKGHAGEDVQIPSNNVDIDKETGIGVITWTVPNDVSGDLNVVFKSDKEGVKDSKVELHMCEPRISSYPDCVSLGKEFEYTIDNVCPTVAYQVKNDRNSISKRLYGKTSYTLKSTIRNFDKQSSAGQEIEYSVFELRKESDWSEAGGFTVTRCEVTSNVVFNLGTNIDAKEACGVGLKYLTDHVFANGKGVVATATEDGRKVTPSLQYRYKESTETDFHDVLSKTFFEVGKSYQLRAMVYVNDQFVTYYDSHEFAITQTGVAPDLTCTSNNANQSVCLGNSITPIILESSVAKIVDVDTLSNLGFTAEHGELSDDKRIKPCSDYYTIKWVKEGGLIKRTFLKITEKNGVNGNFSAVFYDDITKKQLIQDKSVATGEFKDDVLEDDKSYYMVANTSKGKCATFFYKNRDAYGTSSSIQMGEKVTITGTPNKSGKYTYVYKAGDAGCGNQGAELPVIVTVLGDVVCKDYALLSDDGNVSFLLADVVTGDADSWSANNDLAVSAAGMVSGNLPFGETEVSFTATMCEGKTMTCKSKVKVIKKAEPCDR